MMEDTRSKKVLVPLAPGCEELEAVTIVDILRRGGIEVVTAALEKGTIKASRGVMLVADASLPDLIDNNDFDMVVIPGGMGGAQALMHNQDFIGYLKRMAGAGRFIGAICAAPMILGQAGLLDNVTYTAYPGVIATETYPTATYTGAPVEKDKNIITSRGPGTALVFALTILEELAGKETRLSVESQLASV